jgi:hypothetical protein
MPDADRSTLARIWILPRGLGHALAGLCIGAVAGYQLLPHVLSFEKAQALGSLLGLTLAREDMFWFPASLGAVIGVLGGLVWGRMSAAKAARRNAALQEVAQKDGQQFSPEVDGELSAKLARDFSLQHAAISGVLRKDIPGMRAAFGDLAIATEFRHRSDRETRWTTQTAAYFSADVRLPGFTLQPEGFAMNLLSGMSGIEDINFASHEEFSRRYHLSAMHAENARRLFEAPLLEHLERRPGLHVQSAADGLLIYRPGQRLGAEEIEGFIAETTEIFRLFEASARKLQQAREAGLIPKADARAEAAKISGLVGEVVRERLVTRADVEAFMRQAPPRKVPANIRHYCEGFAPGMALAAGALFFLVGAGFAFGFGQAGKWGGALVGLLFAVVGAGLLFFFGRMRLRLERLLRHGELGVGRIEGIESTGWSGPGGDVSRASVRFQAKAATVQAKCNIAGVAVERAQKLFTAKRPAAVLYDPANPERFLLVDALLTVSPELEE